MVNSEFKILNFTSHKKIYFHCLANVELKPHTKFLKNLFRNMASKNLYVTTLYSIFKPQEKQAFDFFKRSSYTNVCLKFLCDAIDNVTSYFLISSKYLKWKQHFHTDRLRITNFWIWLFVRPHIKETTRQKQGALMTNYFLISHRWCDAEKLTVPDSSDLGTQHKVLC